MIDRGRSGASRLADFEIESKGVYAPASRLFLLGAWSTTTG